MIIGQGIAGSVLAAVLQKNGFDVSIAEAERSPTPSAVSAGIINPITGKRYVKSWMFDDFFPVAKQFYTSLISDFQMPIWHEKSIVRMLPSPLEVNEWASKCGDSGYQDFLADLQPTDWTTAFLQPCAHLGEIKNAARVDIAALISSVKGEFAAKNRYFKHAIDYAEVPELLKQYQYLVFCEGPAGKNNPYFPEVAWQLAKGEVLFVRFPNAPEWPERYFLKKNILMAPLGNGLYWVGSNYDWNFEHPHPTADMRAYLSNELKSMLKVPFEIVDHKAAVRPTVKNRRPVAYSSTQNRNIFIFNGLGTKGTLLAPYWSESICRTLQLESL